MTELDRPTGPDIAIKLGEQAQKHDPDYKKASRAIRLIHETPQSPIEAAKEIVELCKKLPKQLRGNIWTIGINKSFSGYDNYNSPKNPMDERLGDLIDFYYPGTDAAKGIISEGLREYLRPTLGVSKDDKYPSIPHQLGIDIKKKDPGVLDEGQAREMEQFALFKNLWGVVAFGHYGMNDIEGAEFRVTFLTWGQQFKEKYGKTFYDMDEPEWFKKVEDNDGVYKKTRERLPKLEEEMKEWLRGKAQRFDRQAKIAEGIGLVTSQ